jgi:hypothetical protein
MVPARWSHNLALIVPETSRWMLPKIIGFYPLS